MPHLAGLAAIILCAASQWASAADGEWGSADSGSWSAPENWASNTVADGAGFTAKFDGFPESGLTVKVDSPRTIGHLAFADPTDAPGESWILRGDPAAGGTLTLAGPSPSIFVEKTATQRHVILDVALAGNEGFTKKGPGVLLVRANNTCSGPILIEGGAVSFSPPPARSLTTARRPGRSPSTNPAASSSCFPRDSPPPETSNCSISNREKTILGR